MFACLPLLPYSIFYRGRQQIPIDLLTVLRKALDEPKEVHLYYFRDIPAFTLSSSTENPRGVLRELVLRTSEIEKLKEILGQLWTARRKGRTLWQSQPETQSASKVALHFRLPHPRDRPQTRMNTAFLKIARPKTVQDGLYGPDLVMTAVTGNTALEVPGVNPLYELRENGPARMHARILTRKNLKKMR